MANQDERIGTILAKIEDIERMTLENKYAIIGRDGNPGLVGNFTALCARVSGLEQLLNNDIAHLSAKIDLMFTSHEKTDRVVEDTESAAEKRAREAEKRVKELEDANTVKRTDLLKEWVKPILVAIITAVLVYLIVTKGVAGG